MPAAFQLTLHDELATDRLGTAIARSLHPGDVVALNGPLGAGKTRLTRAIAIAVGVDPALVHSPTYVLANEYPADGLLDTVVHIDAYRLSDADELPAVLDLGRPGLRDAVAIIEWADRLAELGDASAVLERVTLSVRLSHAGPTERTAELDGELAATVAERFGRTVAATAPEPRVALCRSCGRPIPGGPAAGPFCSDRCRLVDLGHWAEERYRISRAIKDSDLDEDA
jgi:tRNA threonylcarbamoyladenosine biosynthesis protein TsaE